MTTKLKEKYNITTAAHQGVFPYCYWDSKSISLYGCEDITCSLRLHPNGDSENTIGKVAAFINFTIKDSNTSHMDIQFSINVGEHSQKTIATMIIGNNNSAIFKKQGSRGFALCPTAFVLNKEGVEVGFSVTLQKIVTSTAEKTVSVTPMGECLHDYTIKQEPKDDTPNKKAKTN